MDLLYSGAVCCFVVFSVCNACVGEWVDGRWAKVAMKMEVEVE